MFLDQCARLCAVEVAGHGEDGVIGGIVGREEMLDVIEARLVEILHRPDE